MGVITDQENFVLFRLVAVAICGTFGIVFNAVNSIILSYRSCGFASTHRLLIRILAVVDLLTAVCILIIENVCLLTEIPNTWPGFCKLTFPWFMFFGTLSMFLIGLMSFDRFVFFKCPLRYSLLMRRKYVYIMIIFVTLMATFEAIGTTWEVGPLDGIYFSNATRFCRVKVSTNSNPHILGIGLGFTALAVILVISFNFYFVVELISYFRSRRRFANNPAEASRLARSAEKHKILRLIVVVTFAYIVCWLPLFRELIHVQIDKERVVSTTNEFLNYYPAYSNSWVNAVIYVFLSEKYRNVLIGSFLSWKRPSESAAGTDRRVAYIQGQNPENRG